MSSNHIEYILKHLEESVGVEGTDFTKDKWYTEHTWSRDQEDGFIDWLSDYLYTHSEARDELMFTPRKTKKACFEVASIFVFNFGWRTE